MESNNQITIESPEKIQKRIEKNIDRTLEGFIFLTLASLPLISLTIQRELLPYSEWGNGILLSFLAMCFFSPPMLLLGIICVILSFNGKKKHNLQRSKLDRVNIIMIMGLIILSLWIIVKYLY